MGIQFGISEVYARSRRVGVEERVVLDEPFFTLRHFRKAGRKRQPPVLLVAPMSGHFSWILYDTVLGLLPAHDLFLLDWRDARLIPAAAGRFGLGGTIGAVRTAVRTLGPGLTVMGVSQAPATILAAAALMAAQSDPARPAGLVLMGGFIDTRVNPTGVARLARLLPPLWFQDMVARQVPAHLPGAGRRVYPARAQALALERYLARHLLTGGELAGKVRDDDGSDPVGHPFLTLYSTLMDLPAEFVEESVRAVFVEHRLATGRLAWKRHAVEPEAIRDIALMTVEGARDDSSGPGQTHAAHALTPHLPEALRVRYTDPEAGHFGLFHGRPWRERVLPRVSHFIASLRFPNAS